MEDERARQESSQDGSPQSTAERPKQANKPKKEGKDFWDKFSTISTLLSTILIAAVGGYVGHRFEEQQAEEQKKIQETQAVAQLMPFLTGKDQQQKRTAFIAIKALGNTKLMIDIASSDPQSPGAREALRDVEFHAPLQSDRELAVYVLRNFEFAIACDLPFQEVALQHPIDFSDQSCGMYGNPSSTALRIQNLIKNNFCATTDFTDVSTSDFSALQQQVDSKGILGDTSQIPVDRRPFKHVLKDVGEGSAVRFTGYIMDAHYSNLGKGESVNCKSAGPEANDIHISLANKADESDLCQSITAEISPHMRPEGWEPAALARQAEGKVLVRIGGQLMYDAGHRPCSDGFRRPPQRLSTWEIHPVYSIEICRNAQQGKCPADGWKPLAPPPTQ